MCLCLQPYRHNTRYSDEGEQPGKDDEHLLPELKGSAIFAEIHGKSYVAVRNCDLDRFSVK